MINNLMLLHDNEVDRAAIVASSELASLPVSNLQDQQRTEMWRSNGAGVQTLDITLSPDEEQVQSFALVDHNLTLAGTVKIEAWDDALGGAVQTYNVTLQPYQPAYGYGDQLYGEGLYGGYDIYINGLSIADARAVLRPILTTQISPALASRYWRITIVDGAVSYYQASRVYLGPAWQPTVNYSWGATRSRENRTLQKESRGGQKYGNPRTGRSVISFKFDWLNDADRDRLWIIHMLLGNSSPFILIQRPVGGYEQESSTLYGVFDQLNLQQVFLDNTVAPVVFKESL